MNLRYFARRCGTVACGRESLDIWIVIQTDEVLQEEALAAGFEPVPGRIRSVEGRRVSELGRCDRPDAAGGRVVLPYGTPLVRKRS